MLHTEHGLFGIPAWQRLELGQSSLDTRQGVGCVGANLQALLGVNGPVQCFFGNRAGGPGRFR